MPGQRPSDVLTAWVSHTTKALGSMCEGSQLLLASRTTRILAPEPKQKVGTGYRPLGGAISLASRCAQVSARGHGTVTSQNQLK